MVGRPAGSTGACTRRLPSAEYCFAYSEKFAFFPFCGSQGEGQPGERDARRARPDQPDQSEEVRGMPVATIST